MVFISIVSIFDSRLRVGPFVDSFSFDAPISNVNFRNCFLSNFEYYIVYAFSRFFFFCWWCDHQASEMEKESHTYTPWKSVHVCRLSPKRVQIQMTHFILTSCFDIFLLLRVYVSISFQIFFPPSRRRLLLLLLSFHLCCVNQSRQSLQWHCVSVFSETKILIMESISQAKNFPFQFTINHNRMAKET